MDWKRKISADHTDVAYREAVGRLRAILSPRPGQKHGLESPVRVIIKLMMTANKALKKLMV
jgi:hypothetical protein